MISIAHGFAFVCIRSHSFVNFKNNFLMGVQPVILPYFHRYLRINPTLLNGLMNLITRHQMAN